MSQINSDASRRSRRIRAGQKRPTLVTQENGYEAAETLEQQSSETVSAVAVEEKAPSTPNPRRMKGFFTNIGKEKEETTDESEVTRARLARATRGKLAKNNNEQETSKKVATQEKPATTANSAKAPARSGGFKLRHIIGLALYLVLSNLIGYAETAVMNTMGWDKQVANFNLFGQPITISTSTIVFLATLIIILIVLARLDLLPTRMTSTQPARRKDGPASVASAKREQITIRRGESGPDDELYQSYRQNQRREKKR
jgi:hypothetical protein